MFYFLGVYMLVLVFGANIYCSKRIPKTSKRTLTNEKILLFIVFSIFFLALALEDIESNTDMVVYSESYFKYQNYTFASAFKQFLGKKDPVYHMTAFVCMKVGFGFYAWHTLVAFVYAFSITNLIAKYSSNISISVMMTIALGSFGFALSGIRQTIALSIIMWSFKYLHNKKLFKFLIVVLIASLYHSTALIFLIAYLFYNIKFKVKNLIIISLCGMFVILNSTTFLKLYLLVSGTDKNYSSYLEADTVLSITGALIAGAILLFCIFAFMKGKKDVQYTGLCNLAIISLTFRILSALDFAEMFRGAMYFSIFDILMVAEACACDSKKKTWVRIKTIAVSLLLFAYYLISQSSNIMSYIMRDLF